MTMDMIRKAIGFFVVAIVLTTSSPVFVGHERNRADDPYVAHERNLADEPFVGHERNLADDPYVAHERMGWTFAEHDRNKS
jgi:hypothetical protein